VPDAVVEVIRDAVQRSFQLTVKVDRTLVSPDTTTASSVSHVATSVISSLIFVTNIKTKTRITGLRFKKTSMRIKVVQKTKMKYEVEKNFEKKTNENNNYFSDK